MSKRCKVCDFLNDDNALECTFCHASFKEVDFLTQNKIEKKEETDIEEKGYSEDKQISNTVSNLLYGKSVETDVEVKEDEVQEENQKAEVAQEIDAVDEASLIEEKLEMLEKAIEDSIDQELKQDEDGANYSDLLYGITNKYEGSYDDTTTFGETIATEEINDLINKDVEITKTQILNRFQEEDDVNNTSEINGLLNKDVGLIEGVTASEIMYGDGLGIPKSIYEAEDSSGNNMNTQELLKVVKDETREEEFNFDTLPAQKKAQVSDEQDLTSDQLMQAIEEDVDEQKLETKDLDLLDRPIPEEYRSKVVSAHMTQEMKVPFSEDVPNSINETMEMGVLDSNDAHNTLLDTMNTPSTAGIISSGVTRQPRKEEENMDSIFAPEPAQEVAPAPVKAVPIEPEEVIEEFVDEETIEKDDNNVLAKEELYVSKKEEEKQAEEDNLDVEVKEELEKEEETSERTLEETIRDTFNIARAKVVDLLNIRPMEIRPKIQTEVSSSKPDRELNEAEDIFNNIDEYRQRQKEEMEALEEAENKPVESTKETQEKEKETPSAFVSGDNSKKKKKNDDNNNKPSKPRSFVRRALITSGVILTVVFALMFIIKSNQAKQLNAYAMDLKSREIYSYSEMVTSLVSRGFDEEDVVEVIESLDIDFSKNALNLVLSLAKDTNKLATKDDVRMVLSEKGFSEAEVESAIISTDWNEFLETYLGACIDKVRELDKKTVLETIEKAGYSQMEVIKITKSEKWPSLAEKNAQSYISSEDLISKDDVVNHLKDLTYTEEEIEKALENFNWSNIAFTYITNYKEVNSNVESTRNSYKSILMRAGFTEEETEEALSQFDFNSYAKDEIAELIDNSKKIVSRKEIENSLEADGYTKEEIEEALKEIDWDAAALKSAKVLDTGKISKNEIVEELKTAGYPDESLEYLEESYDWTTQAYNYMAYLVKQEKAGGQEYTEKFLEEQGYDEDAISYVLASFDFRVNAKNAIESYTLKNENCSKNKAKQYLEELKFGSTEVAYAMNSVDWERKALVYIEYVGYTSRVDAENTLSAQGFSQSEINSAINSIGSEGWKKACVNRLTSLYKDVSDSDKCTAYKEIMNGSGSGSIKTALIKENYQETEFEYARQHWSVSAPCALN